MLPRRRHAGVGAGFRVRAAHRRPQKLGRNSQITAAVTPLRLSGFRDAPRDQDEFFVIIRTPFPSSMSKNAFIYVASEEVQRRCIRADVGFVRPDDGVESDRAN